MAFVTTRVCVAHQPRLGLIPPLLGCQRAIPLSTMHWRAITTRSSGLCHHHHHQLSPRRWLHQAESERPARPSRHAQFYSDLVPAMIPVALLGSAVYMV